MTNRLRVLQKFLLFLWVSARALFDSYFNRAKSGSTPAQRVAWSNRWGKEFQKVLGIQIEVRGTIPTTGILVCNHLSYVDIVVLGAVRQQVFLSKAEVINWPILGRLAQSAGTIFIRRDSKMATAAAHQSLRQIISAGIPVTIFPEGTSSDGSRVLPFYSSLLEPAVQLKCTVTPAWIGYRLDQGEGSVPDEICYWRDMTFLPHFLRLLTKKRIYATLIFGEPLPPGLNRKEMAATLHRQVTALSQTQRPPNQIATKLVGEPARLAYSSISNL